MAKKKRNSPEYQWEEELLGAFYNYRWHEVLDPLYDKMQLWKQGKLEHDDIDKAIHETHKETQHLYGVFTEKRDFLLLIAQQTTNWFKPWLAEHPAPPGVILVEPVNWDVPEASEESDQ